MNPATMCARLMPTADYPESRAVIYRCSRRCERTAGRRVAKRVDVPFRRVMERDRFGNLRTAHVVYLGHDGHESRGFLPSLYCDLCDRPMIGKRIDGRKDDAVRCDARCTGAVGHSCECSCGGANHGRDYAA